MQTVCHKHGKAAATRRHPTQNGKAGGSGEGGGGAMAPPATHFGLCGRVEGFALGCEVESQGVAHVPVGERRGWEAE